GLSSKSCRNFFFQAEDGIRDFHVTGVQTCALPILPLEAYASAIPFGLTEMRPMIAADARVRAKVPEMNAAFEQNGQVYLAGAISENMHLFTTFPVKTVHDHKGKKIDASGALAN